MLTKKATATKVVVADAHPAGFELTACRLGVLRYGVFLRPVEFWKALQYTKVGRFTVDLSSPEIPPDRLSRLQGVCSANAGL